MEVLNTRTTNSPWWLRAAYPVILLGIALGATGGAVADEFSGLFRLESHQVLSSPRDPVVFMEDLDLVLPRPVVILDRQDAVARELLRYTRTMSETDALRVAQTLCEEAAKRVTQSDDIADVTRLEVRIDVFDAVRYWEGDRTTESTRIIAKCQVRR